MAFQLSASGLVPGTPVWSPGKDLAGEPSLVCLIPSLEGEETCPYRRTTREEEVTQSYSHERMRRESEGRLRLGGSVSNEWRVGRGWEKRNGGRHRQPKHHLSTYT